MTKKSEIKTGGVRKFWDLLKRIWKGSQKSTSNDLQQLASAYYLKISECPLVAWEKRFKEGNQAIRRDNIEFNYNEELDYEAWNELYIDWESKVKQEPSFVEYKKNLILYNQLIIKFLKSKKDRQGVTVRDRSILNQIRRIEASIVKYEKNLGQGKTINQNIQILSKAQGYQINKHNMTVEDYFDLIELNSEKPSKNG